MNTNYLTKSHVLPCLAIIVAQVFLISAYAADSNEKQGLFSDADYAFVKAAACGGMLEVNLGNMAAANSRNTEVQKFGLCMAKDHGKAGQDLQQLASSEEASLPSQLTTGQQKEVDRLAKLSGPEFDKAYMSLMVKCHKADEKAFKRESEEAQDSKLRDFAATTLTMVQAHLKMAEDLDEGIKNELSMNK